MIIRANKGVALLWVLLLSVVLLILSGTMVTYITKESQSSVRTESSVKAYAAAKSGIDWALVMEKKNPGFDLPNCPASTPVNIENNVTASVCEVSAGVIRSNGSAFGSLRTIEHKTTEFTYTNITPGTTTINDNMGSFELVFNFYMLSPNVNAWFLGLSDGVAGTNAIGLFFNGTNGINPDNGFHILKKVNGGEPELSAVAEIGSGGLNPINQDGLTKARLKVVRGEYATLTFEGQLENSGTCLNIISLPLSDFVGVNLKTIHGYAKTISGSEAPVVSGNKLIYRVGADSQAVVTYMGYKLN